MAHEDREGQGPPWDDLLVTPHHPPHASDNKPHPTKEPQQQQEEEEEEEGPAAAKMPGEILLHIFQFLPLSDVSACSVVCHAWHQVLEDGAFWYAMAQRPVLAGADSYRLRPPPDWNPPLEHWKSLYQVSRQLGHPHQQQALLHKALAASTTDHDSQAAHCTLEDSQTFWSSGPSPDDTAEEWLCYRLRQPVCLVTAVDLWAFCATFQPHMPIFGPRAAQIYLGYEGPLEDLEGPAHPWERYTWHSPPVALANVAEGQRLAWPPCVALGGILTVRLLGKYSVQEAHDGLYYTSIRRVVAWGVPVGAIPSRLFGQQMLQYAMTQRGCLALLQEYWRELVPAREDESEGAEDLPPSEALWDLLHLQSHQWERYWWRKHQQTQLIVAQLAQSQPSHAALLARQLPLECRDRAYVQALQNVEGAMVPYLAALHALRTPLSEEESLALLQIPPLRPYAREFHQRQALFCSLAVGDALVATDPQLACVVYLSASCFDRAIDVAARQGQLEVILSFWRNESFAHTFLPTLCEMTRHCGVLTSCQAATHLCRTVPREGTRAVCRWIREQLQEAPYNVTERALSKDADLRQVVSWLQWYVHQEHPTHYHHTLASPHPHDDHDIDDDDDHDIDGDDDDHDEASTPSSPYSLEGT